MIESSSQTPQVDTSEAQEPVEISRRIFLGRMGRLLAALTAVIVSDKLARNPFLRTPPTLPLPVDLDNPEFLLSFN